VVILLVVVANVVIYIYQQRNSFLTHFPPMGVYEVLFAFKDACGAYLGTEDTHPYAQGFPMTSPVPGGPEIPTTISFNYSDLKYPSATGEAVLLNAVRDYYNHFYSSNITTDNICIFAGGRPGIYAALSFLKPNVKVLVEETEYPPYWDALNNLKRKYQVIPSNPSNRFRPTIDNYRAACYNDEEVLMLRSNPCNPTGVALAGDQLREFVEYFSEEGRGAIFDEAYEFFTTSEPDSAMRYVKDIDNTNIFVVGAATKGLQAPGLRIGWVISSKKNVELFRNFSSIGMGGVARPSQFCAAVLLQLDRVAHARKAIHDFYCHQRDRYGDLLKSLGCELFTGDGGFYHWIRLPNGLTADEFNRRLFQHKAAILPGALCDMFRRGTASPHTQFIRFSFGPLTPDSFEKDAEIIRACIE
jgi:aspartate/methionine/tyrosine aminotransferase